MANLFDALVGNLGDESHYYSQDPFYMGGAGFAKMQLPQAQTNSQAIFGPALQGLLAGSLLGYGQRHATQTAYEEAKQNPLLKQLYGDYRPPGADFGPLTEEASTQAPEGWTIGQGRQDAILQAIMAQGAQEAAQERARLMAQFDPAVLAGEGIKAQMIEHGKALGKPDKQDMWGISAEGTNEIGKATAVIDESLHIANELERIGPSWGNLQASKMFSGADKEGIGLTLKDLADRLARARTGAAMNAHEVELYNKMVSGDMTANPDQVAKLLKKLAAAEARYVKSRTNFDELVQTGGRAAVAQRMDQVLSGMAPTPAPMAGVIDKQAAIAELRRRGVIP